MKWFFLSIFDFFKNHKKLYWLVLIGFLALLSFFSMRVNFEEDISKMLQMDEKTRQYSNIIQNTKFADQLLVTVRLKDSTITDEHLLISYADSFYSLLSKDSSLIKKIILRNDDMPFAEVYQAILTNLPLFLEPKDYEQFDSLLQKERLVAHLNNNMQLLSSPAGIMVKKSIPYDPAGISNSVMKRLQSFGKASDYELVNGYFFSKDHKQLVFFIEPAHSSSETGKNKYLIYALNDYREQLENSPPFEKIKSYYIGSTAIAVGNAQQIQQDTILTLGILIIAIILIISLIFKRKRTPILIFLPVTFGLLFALAMIGFIKPSISLIAIGASSVLLGIAVNYPIHLLTHNLHVKNLRTAISDMVVPMSIGSATTVGGFFCLLFVQSEILHDLGLLGIFSLIGAALFTLVFLPHLMGDVKEKSSSNSFEKALNSVSKIKLENSKIPVLIILGLTPVLLYFAQFVSFDSDLSKLNYMDEELKEAESQLRDQQGYGYSLYVISYGKNLNEAFEASQKIKNVADSLNKIDIKNSYSGIAAFVPSIEIQKERITKWENYWTNDKVRQLKQNLNSAAIETGFSNKAFERFFTTVESPVQLLNDDDFQLLLATFGGDAISQKREMSTIVSVIKVPIESLDIATSMISQLEGNTLLDQKFLSTNLLNSINADFNFIAIFCAILVFLALLLTYGRIELALTAFLPMVVSWIWILGLMGLLGVQFNVVNIILSTFIFGLGDDYCIFIMDGLLQEYKNGKKHMHTIKLSIILSGITTLIGFGVLLIAQHPALKSIAVVSVIGILSVLIVSQTLEPWLFKMFIKNPVSRKQAPVNAFTFLKSIWVFSFFVIGSILLNIAAFFLVYLNIFAKEKGRYIFRTVICKFMYIQLYIAPNVKKTIINNHKHTFDKPSIIISNHQSVIDVLIIGMLSPKIILLTNKWVWNSPLFGFAVRMAGFIPIVEGIEESIGQIKEKIRQGYSIAIFPEGTRSKDGKIGRFHKGAFHLAKELNLDITPIVLHGIDKCIQKGSFVLRDNPISLKILPRIKAEDESFGITMQERTKSIARYFRNEFEKFSGEIENTSYYKRLLIDSYIFKGPVLEWYMKVKLRMEKNYQVYDLIVPKQGTIVDAGCGYGFMSHMLAFIAPQRNIVGFDYDAEKVELAANTFSKPDNLHFETGNVLNYDYPQADCFIFNDVLHYLEPGRYMQVLDKCLLNLNSEGIIIVRDSDSVQKNHSKTRFSEFLSTRIFRFNKTENELNFFSINDLKSWAEKSSLKVKVLENENFASNKIIILHR